MSRLLAVVLILLLAGCATVRTSLAPSRLSAPCDFTLTGPANNATLGSGGPVYAMIQANPAPTTPGAWMNYYVNAPMQPLMWRASGSLQSGSVSLGPLVAGTWVITAAEYVASSTGVTLVCPAQTVMVTTTDATAPLGPTIPGLTGDASGLSGNLDTNLADFGHYGAPGGYLGGFPLIGGPLLTDLQAAQKVVVTQHSAVEIAAQCMTPVAPDAQPCPHGVQNNTANNYFEGVAVPNSSAYLAQLNNFYSAWPAGAYGGAIRRIDGACPLVNPTTGEILQWVANKWGLNPLLLYAEATQEGQWDQLALGDVADNVGTSSGVIQVADRNTAHRPYHAPPGFTGPSANLARENTCFDVDFYAAQLWAAFNGFLPSTAVVPQGNIGAAIQAWFGGMNGTTAPGSYSAGVQQHLTTEDWTNYFQGQAVAY